LPGSCVARRRPRHAAAKRRDSADVPQLGRGVARVTRAPPEPRSPRDKSLLPKLRRVADDPPMRLTRLTLLVLMTTGPLASCKSTPKTPPPPPASAAKLEDRAEPVEDRAVAVQTARSAIDEAAALRRLRAYCVEHGYTYEVNARGTPGVAPAEIVVYQREQPLHRFTFVPRDVQNLQILSATGGE
jgi:hypothetical protein